ncbi:zinc finger protein 37-like isoform X2 [Perca flavescens]|uniref:zinc finger protein 37-like isoform X2 n=1 Tax=Perca flavescens TaxID=8167 RepID=UPI00106E846E|nr:zinc finger protein 37-like isoform X2 [Perca flavescens]
MSSVECLREFVTERLTAAAEQIFRVVEKTIVEYEEEIARQRRLLDGVWRPEIRLHRIELPQQHVCKEEEVLSDQQLCIQERNSSLDQEDPESPQIKEEQEELCISQEGEQLVLKQETDTFMLTPTYEERDHSEGQTLNFNPDDDTLSAAEKESVANMPVITSVESEANSDHQLLSPNSHEAESQDQKGDKHGDSGSTRNTEPEPKKRRRKRRSHSNNVDNTNVSEIHPNAQTELPQQHVCKEEEVLSDQQLCIQERNSSLDQEDPESPQINEDQEELCTSQEGEQLVLKQETDTFMLAPTYEERDHSEGQTLNFSPDDDTLSAAEKESVANMPVLTSVVSEANSDHQLLSPNSHEAESQDQKGGKHGDSGSTRNTEPEPKKRRSKSRSHSNNVDNTNVSEIHPNTPTELRQQHVCKEEEVLSDQQLCIQEMNSSLDQEDPESPQINEDQEELCTSQEGEQLVLKQETDPFTLAPTYEERDHSKGQTLNFSPDDDTLSAAEKESVANMPVITSVVSEANSDHQLLSPNSHEAESQDQKGDKHGDSGSTRNTEPEPKKRRRKRRSHSNNVDNTNVSEIRPHTQTGKKSFICDTCEKDFKYNSDLQRHLRIHTGEKPYCCETCGKDFRHKDAFNVHMRTHTGEKPYVCKTCGKGFGRNGNLLIHMRRAHTGEKPYVCKTCRKRFYDASALLKHMITHTGERPYSCKTCGKGFGRNDHLLVHMRRAHTALGARILTVGGPPENMDQLK